MHTVKLHIKNAKTDFLMKAPLSGLCFMLGATINLNLSMLVQDNSIVVSKQYFVLRCQKLKFFPRRNK